MLTKFKIYEYVLNRVEYRFKDDELDEEYYNTYMTNDIMLHFYLIKIMYLSMGRISEMVGQASNKNVKKQDFMIILKMHLRCITEHRNRQLMISIIR